MSLALALAAGALVVPPRPASAQSCLAEPTGADACRSPKDAGSHARGWSAPHHVGNPIDVLGGNKYQREDDYRALGSPLMFARHYNSALVAHDLGLGPGWRHTYHVVLSRVDERTLRIVQSDGRPIEFVASELDGRLVHRSEGGRDGHVERDGPHGHRWHLPDGRRLHFHGSWLTRIAHEGRPERRLDLRYRHGRLVRVTDAAGHALRLRYTPTRSGLGVYDGDGGRTVPGHLEAIELPDGTEIALRYDHRRNAALTRYPDGSEVRHGHDDPLWPHHLTERQSGGTTRRWAYGPFGRIVAHEAGGGGRALTIDYDGGARDGAGARSDGDGAADDTTTHGTDTDPHRTAGAGTDAARTGVTVVRRDGGPTSAYRWVREGDGRTRHVVETVERACEDCPERVYRASARESASAADADDGVAPPPPPPDTLETTPGTITYVDARGRPVRIEADRRGKVIDVVRDGVSMDGLMRRLAAGEGLDCGASDAASPPLADGSSRSGDDTGHAGADADEIAALRCLLPLLELMEIAERADELFSPPTPYERKRQLTGADRFCSPPAGRTCEELQRDLEMARLSACAYRGPCGRHWEDVSLASLGIDTRQFGRYGFDTRLVRNVETGEYVLAFTGTDDRADVIQDLLQFGGVTPSQYRQARLLAENLRDALPGVSLSYTGHSLGGGLATVAALETGDRATVFNSAALHPDVAASMGLPFDRADELVDNLTVDGEIVTSIQDRPHNPPGYHPPNHDVHVGRPERVAYPAPGQRFLLPQPAHAWMEARDDANAIFLRPDPVQRHLLETVIESLVTLLEVACGIPRWLTD